MSDQDSARTDEAEDEWHDLAAACKVASCTPTQALRDAAVRARPDPAQGRLIAHVDADTFFLAVHERVDPSLRDVPAAVWQYNDVICVSHSARPLGVRKHMRPEAARPLVEAAGGRLVHAFWRDWPGPRVWYGPYNAASRELFAALRHAASDAVAAAVPDRCARAAPPLVEHASIDEGYVDLSALCAPCAVVGPPRLPAAEAFDERALAAIAERVGARLRGAVRASTGLVVSVGVSHSKLLAKLASSAAKPPDGGGVRVAVGEAAARALLDGSRARALPGLGNHAHALDALGVGTVAELRARFASPAELRAELHLGEAQALAVWARARGEADCGAVRAVVPQSVTVTSWSTHTTVAQLLPAAGAQPLPAGGVRIGSAGWAFVPHASRGKTNDSRPGWLLLALCLDLDERVLEHALLHGRLPTRLALALQGPGNCPEPSPGYRAGPVRSRAVDFPLEAYAACARTDLARALDALESPLGGAPSAAGAVPQASAGGGGGAAALDEPRFAARVGALVDAAAGAVHRWAAEEGSRRVAQLTLVASAFRAVEACATGRQARLVLQSDARRAATPNTSPAHAVRARCAQPASGTSPDRSIDVRAVDPAVLAELPAELQEEVRAALAASASTALPCSTAASVPAALGDARRARAADAERELPAPRRAKGAGAAPRLAARGTQPCISAFFAPASG